MDCAKQKSLIVNSKPKSKIRFPFKYLFMMSHGFKVFLRFNHLLYLAFFIIISCNTRHPLFKKISGDQSGIHFNNKIVENDSINPLDVTNIYNGGGVGIGDFNNDKCLDIVVANYGNDNMLHRRLHCLPSVLQEVLPVYIFHQN